MKQVFFFFLHPFCPVLFFSINWIMINASFNVMENLTETSIYYDTVLL